VFGLGRQRCDGCGREFKGEGLYLPSRRKVFCFQACVKEYIEELEKKGRMNVKTDGSVYEVGGCC